jgi:hypothetical protein
MHKDAPWMKWDRARNETWLLRQKRSDTHIWTIEEKYWIDLWVRSDMELGNYLQREGYKSLNDLIHNQKQQ